MIETALNAVWIALAIGVLFAAPRCTPRVRVALFCALVLLFPIISISDDISANTATSPDEVAALAIAMVIAFLLIAVFRVHSVAEPAYAVTFAAPSDPRSPPR